MSPQKYKTTLSNASHKIKKRQSNKYYTAEENHNLKFKIGDLFSLSFDGNYTEISIWLFFLKINKKSGSVLLKYLSIIIKWVYTIIRNFVVTYPKIFYTSLCLIAISVLFYTGYFYIQKIHQNNCQVAFQYIRKGNYSLFNKMYDQFWISKRHINKGKVAILLSSELIPQAETKFNDLKKSNALDFSANVLHGHLLFCKGEMNKAQHIYDNTIQTTNDRWSESESYYGLGNIFFVQEKYQQAINEYGKALKIDQNFVLAHIGKGISQEMINQFEKASDQYRKAQQILQNNTIGNTQKIKNVYSKLLDFLYNRNIEVVSCDNTESCKFNVNHRINQMMKKSLLKIKQSIQRAEFPLKCIFIPFKGKGMNPFIPGANIMLSEMIAQKLNKSNLIQIEDRYFIYSFTKEFSKTYYSIIEQDKIAYNIGKFTKTDLIISGNIERNINDISVNLIITDIAQKKVVINLKENMGNHNITNFSDDIVEVLLEKFKEWVNRQCAE